MKEKLISFDTAKLAKKKGFNNKTAFAIINNSEGEERIMTYDGNPYYSFGFVAWLPTQSLLQRWLREEHNMDLYVAPMELIIYDITTIAYVWCIYKVMSSDGMDNYEEALEQGLLEGLKLLP